VGIQGDADETLDAIVEMVSPWKLCGRIDGVVRRCPLLQPSNCGVAIAETVETTIPSLIGWFRSSAGRSAREGRPRRTHALVHKRIPLHKTPLTLQAACLAPLLRDTEGKKIHASLCFPGSQMPKLQT